ncbi:MAG: hypothetical protein FD153_450 [Rhodospirillaceae bacterium]|nr:MAG: hypothetical protein FD153_450 [Rhodospirillaceae bacterium]
MHAGDDWFSMELGVVIDGVRVNLLPLLVRVLQDEVTRTVVLAAEHETDLVPVPLADGPGCC